MNWVIPGDGITLLDAPATDADADAFEAEVAEVRHLGEVTLCTLALASPPAVALTLSVTGAARRDIVVGARRGIRLEPALVHVMPLRSR